MNVHFIVSEEVDRSLTMVQLGMDSLMSSEIKQTLYRNYQIDFDIGKIQDLTFEYFITLNTDKHKSNVQIPNKISTKYSDICLIAKHSALKLKSGNNGRTLFILHPIEGHIQSMVSLASRISATVYGLQCTKECKYQTIHEYAIYFKKLIRQKQAIGPYIFCGNSYGSLLCLELAFILEAEGETVHVISVDGAPEYFKFASGIRLMNSTEHWDINHHKKIEIFVSGFPDVDKEQVSSFYSTPH